MVLVDRLIEATDDSVVCEVSISPDSAYATANSVPNIVVLECMAQAVSVFVGLSNRREGKPIRDGYLVGINNAQFDVDGFAIGAKLRVSAKRTWGSAHFASFECKTTVDDTEAASATLNVYQVRQVEDEP
jgi:predicted hotdog family 3-hydroxylacyl-ACP dehydratase